MTYQPRTRTEHERWVKEKVREGWIWGSFEDPIYLEHPLIMAFDQLPEKLKTKDPEPVVAAPEPVVAAPEPVAPKKRGRRAASV